MHCGIEVESPKKLLVIARYKLCQVFGYTEIMIRSALKVHRNT